MMQLQDGFAWGSGGMGLLFLFIILLIVILTWKRCPSSCCYPSAPPHHHSVPETQLVQTASTEEDPSMPEGEASSSSACTLTDRGNPRSYMFKCTSYP